jgi:HD-GYP domain-containing protein (c-di-GMP phosphodiesterase class II)
MAENRRHQFIDAAHWGPPPAHFWPAGGVARQDAGHGVGRLLGLLQDHDPETYCHSQRVRGYAVRLAAALGLGRRARRRLALAAGSHDLGKLCVPAALLTKPSRLTAEEYLRVQKHPVMSELLLAPLVRDPGLLAWVRHHHEHFDGRGYPDGLRGRHIPLGARLLAVADCFDALSSPRPYRAALPRRDALDYLRAGAGRQFDPAVVRAFLRAGEAIDAPPPSPPLTSALPAAGCRGSAS